MYFYSSLSSDAPRLNNTWGDFNNLINYLIDGGTEYNILKIEPYADKGVKIYYDDTLTACPWVQFQTIVLTGSTKNYNGDFFIEQINESDKFIIAYRSNINFLLSEEEVGEANVMKARVKPCGATRLLGGVTEQRTVIKFDGSIEFRIDDRNFAALLTPAVTFNNAWSKLARVCMAESFDTLDFTTKRMWPYNATRPNENFTPHGNYIGQSFMVYNDNSPSNYYITNTSAKSGCAYKVYANNKCMYIQIFQGNTYQSSYSRFFIIGGYNSLNKEIPNGLIQSHRPGGDNAYNTTTYHMAMDTQAQRCDFTYSVTRINTNIVMYDNGSGVAADALFYGGFGYGSAQPSGNGGLRLPNILDSNIYFSDAQVIATSSYHGKLYDVKWVNTDYRPTAGTTALIDNELYICNLSFDSSTFFKLDRP